MYTGLTKPIFQIYHLGRNGYKAGMGLSVDFYKTSALKCPVVDFLDSLSGKVAQKITWVLRLIEEIDVVPIKYFKKLSPYDIWEVRIDFSGNTYRILSFMYNEAQLILTHGFIKKTQKTPQNEIEKALTYKNEYLTNGGWKR
jgi:phage-related protein